LVNGAEIKTVCSPRTIDVSPELVNLFSEYVTAYFSDEVDTNHVFIKLAGANQHHPMDYPAKLLKVKQPRRRPKTLTKDQVGTLLRACSNLRDRFLLQLLWESGMRIGEALALWLEDVEIDAFRVHIRNRGELVNGAEIKTVCSPRTIDVSPELVNLFSEYVTAYFSDEVDTNHVFIKLAGANQHHPMDYPDVVSLFRRLRGKTGIYVTAHMFRHTSLTELKKAGWSAELLRRRAGHANVQTTQQTYIHPSDEEVREQWEKTRKQMRVKDGWKERDTP